MLKRICFVFVLSMLLTLDIYAQGHDSLVVPEAVKRGMAVTFPQSQRLPVNWIKEGNNFKGSLVVMDKPAFAFFDESGRLIRVEKTISYRYLSKKIVEQLNKQFPGNEILDVYEVTDANGTKTYKTTYKYKATTVFKEDGSIVK